MALLSAAGWAAVGAIGSIGMGIYGANEAGDAADAQVGAARDANALQAQTRNMAYTANEPARWTGYQALNDINSLYGYGSAPYTPLNQLTGGGGGVGGMPLSAPERTAGAMPGALGIGGAAGYNYSGYSINPQTGEVTTTDNSRYSQQFNDALTKYLRTGEWTVDAGGSKYLSDARRAIDQVRASGYTWDAAAGRGSLPGSATGTPGQTGSQPGQPGNMSRFFTSPDYTFRRDEGQRGIGNSFAARGGAASGNALRALSEFNSNLASSEYGNYFNRLAGLAGMQQTANTQNQQAGQYAAGQIGQGLQNQGDARASGIMSQYGSLANGFSGAANALGNYFGSRYSTQGTWQPGGAALPGGGLINPNLPWIRT
jgi:hypothetical protein